MGIKKFSLLGAIGELTVVVSVVKYEPFSDFKVIVEIPRMHFHNTDIISHEETPRLIAVIMNFFISTIWFGATIFVAVETI